MIKVEEALILGGLILLLLASWIINYGIIIKNSLMIPFISIVAVVFIVLGYRLKKINEL